MNRKETTKFLSNLLEGELKALGRHYAKEVTIDNGSINVKRVDFMEFTPGVGIFISGIEKGIFITTGNYTKAARDEAANMGKNLIDLIDGEKFIDKLIECEMGVRKKVAYEVDRHFFDKI